MTAVYQICVLDAAAHELARLDRQVRERVVKRMYWLAENLDDIKPIPLSADLAGLYKFRVGDYRIVYDILREEKVIVIHLVGHRRQVYR